jgi:O-antigen/teichoic acid export membrane protein
LRRTIFGRDVLTLVSGTVAAQAIVVGALPLLSRLFAPAAFGLFALYSTIMSLCAFVVSGRYELAVVIPEDDRDGASLVRVALTLAAFGAAVLLVVALFFRRPLAVALGNPALSAWLLVLPLSVFVTSTTQTLNIWFTRIERYRAVATNRVIVAIVSTAASFLFAWLGFRMAGLLLGVIAGQLVGVVLYAYAARISMQERGVSAARDRMRELMHRYRDFPRYSVLADAIGFAGSSTPVLLIGPTFGAAAVGYYGMTQRMLGVPSGVIGGAFADVFRQRAAREMAVTGNCRATWLQTCRELLIIGIPLFLVVIVVGPIVAPPILGKKWGEIAPFVRILGVLYAIGFVASPLGRTLHFGERQRVDLLWQVALVVVTTVTVLVGCRSGDLKFTLWLFVAAYSSMYLVYLVMSYQFAGGRGGPQHEATVADGSEV